MQVTDAFILLCFMWLIFYGPITKIRNISSSECLMFDCIRKDYNNKAKVIFPNSDLDVFTLSIDSCPLVFKNTTNTCYFDQRAIASTISLSKYDVFREVIVLFIIIGLFFILPICNALEISFLFRAFIEWCKKFCLVIFGCIRKATERNRSYHHYPENSPVELARMV